MGVKRIDPVALQPRDFVHEWLREPWQEMKSRSSNSDTLAKWHKLLGGSGDYEFVQPCINRPGFIQVGVGIDFIGDREIPEPLSVVSGVSFETEDDCPGETPPADYGELPLLFKKK
jgi:hypothetical protein